MINNNNKLNKQIYIINIKLVTTATAIICDCKNESKKKNIPVAASICLGFSVSSTTID